MGGILGKIVDFVGIIFEIVEFFDRLSFSHKKFHGGGHFSGSRDASKLFHGSSFFRSVHVLEVRFQWLVVADVSVALVPNAANDVVSLIHAVAGSVNVVAGRGEIFSKEGASLCNRRSGESCEIESGVAKVEGADELVINRSWLALPGCAIFLRDAND